MSRLTAGVAAPPARVHTVRHRGWPEPERVVLPAGADPDSRLVVTNRSLRRDGQPWIPISGEVHYSRLDRQHWPLALQLLRAGGINLISTYVFWNHHQPRVETEPDVTGNRDVAAFLGLCAEEHLPVIIRIGPWCHGEVRHGGFPDWVQNSGFALRTDDPGYLALVQTYFTHLAHAIGPWCGPDGPIVAVQVENELYDQPAHIATLKRLAQQAGISAPIWTATGWGNAQLPLPEVFPVYSAYSEGFWVDAEDEWDDSFRSHFFFSDRWDDPGVGKDVAGAAWTGVAGDKNPDLPPATCELAGGMATAYHRPVPSALDVAALANVKLGSGSAWQGYYMYVGGTNPDGPGGLQESHATGYPNDLPRFNYDFHAPIGRDLATRETFHRLRLQHAFLEAFDTALATMTTTFPPPPTEDRPLRWCLRANNTSGYVFVNNHQPVEPLEAIPGVQFSVQLDHDPIVFPPEPVDIPASAIFNLPVAHHVGGVTIRWATLNLITHLDAPEPVLVAHAHPGLHPQLGLPTGYRVTGADTRQHDHELVATLTPGTEPVTVESPTGNRIHLIVLSSQDALHAWTPTIGNARQLLLSENVIIQRGSSVIALSDGPGTVRVFEPGTRTWTHQQLTADAPAPVPLELIRPQPAGHPTQRSFGGRASAPTRAEIAEFGALYRLNVETIPSDAERAVLVVDLVGDVAELGLAREEVSFDDLFWDGTPWTVDLARFAGTGPLELDLRLTAFDPEASIRLPPDTDRTHRHHNCGAVVHAAELRLTRAHPIAVIQPLSQGGLNHHDQPQPVPVPPQPATRRRPDRRWPDGRAAAHRLRRRLRLRGRR